MVEICKDWMTKASLACCKEKRSSEEVEDVQGGQQVD